MFIIKKIISALIMPLTIGLISLLIALYYLYKKSYSKSKIFFIFGVVWIALIGYQPFSNALLSPLETKYKKLEKIPDGVEYVLLLGGDRKGRTYEVLRLYNMDNTLHIISSGYEGRYEIPEAFINRDFLITLGIPPSQIITQHKPKDTKEEAIATKKIVGEKKFILVTDAIHMERAIKLFNKQGLHPIAAPTNFLVKQNIYFNVPSGRNIEHTERALHEYIGLLWYWIKGDI